jgi:alkylation response protein AidB-like acyl-CoA dehydrogenase
MDFDLPEELQILRDTVRRFVDKELIPLEREYRHDSEGAMPDRLLKPLQEKTKSMGLWMLDVPSACYPDALFTKRSRARPPFPFVVWNSSGPR